jgi:tRNA(Ile)-lysidine synthase
LKGQAAQLSPTQRAALAAFPAAARPALPLLRGVGTVPYCPALDGPGLAAEGGVRACPLVLDRFKAATGQIDQESVT